ncbi:hypothetical protein NKJ88_28410 [Mesorhizobium sp. M0016]|uniref:ABC-three component system protein n=1 Tax=Mesorhizobium sp. M0016 TaxID=2956843 RepID=UPI003339D762
MSDWVKKHSAAQSAAGYLYQARLALAEALRFAYADSSVEVSIERLDDVSFEKNGSAIDLLQTKHHLKRTADLSDASVDLWKTLGIWAAATTEDPSLPGRTRFALVTTATAAAGSAAHILRPVADGAAARDIDAADTLLVLAANKSKNAQLADSIAAFKALAPNLRKSLLCSVEILDGAPLIADLEAVIDGRLAMIAPRGKAPLAREQLEGWWWPRICSLLQVSTPGTISVLELEQKLDDIRDSLKRDALPVEVEDLHPTSSDLEAIADMRFVRQLREIGVGATRLEYAKRDYYRAFVQRSQWVRQSLLFDGEVSRFERTLVEEWQPRFAQMCDALAPECAAAELRQAGLSIYAWVEAEARFPFRALTSRFLNVGSYHMLANELRVGWHRDYEHLFTDEKSLEEA